jgi:predicted membrane-bound spermidine synthase
VKSLPLFGKVGIVLRLVLCCLLFLYLLWGFSVLEFSCVLSGPGAYLSVGAGFSPPVRSGFILIIFVDTVFLGLLCFLRVAVLGSCFRFVSKLVVIIFLVFW